MKIELPLVSDSYNSYCENERLIINTSVDGSCIRLSVSGADRIVNVETQAILAALTAIRQTQQGEPAK